MPIKNQFRQGDVLIDPVSSVPEAALPLPAENGRNILADGEVTGHSHALPAESGSLLTLDPTNEMEKFLVQEKADTLTHEEHEDLTIPDNTYRVSRQRGYEPEDIHLTAD